MFLAVLAPRPSLTDIGGNRSDTLILHNGAFAFSAILSRLRLVAEPVALILPPALYDGQPYRAGLAGRLRSRRSTLPVKASEVTRVDFHTLQLHCSL